MKTKAELLPECPVAITVSLIGNKWKLLIIRNLRMRPWRFNELQKNLEGISQKVLTDNLRAPLLMPCRPGEKITRPYGRRAVFDSSTQKNSPSLYS